VWGGGTENGSGVVKAKAGSVGSQIRFVLNVTAGKYAPPSGQKTKVKFTVSISPRAGYTCADDSDPLEAVNLTSVGGVVVNQK